jgi:ethanolamine permease
LPAFLSKVHPRFKTPYWALIAGSVAGVICIYTGTTDKLIILSALGAVCMYIISMLSLFKLRKKEPNLVRTFKTPFYPCMPIVALVLSVVCLIAICYYNVALSLIFFAALIAALVVFFALGKHKNQVA